MEQHSKNYDKVKKYYKMGFWTEKMVRSAVVKHWITEEEFTEITGKDHNEVEETPEV